MIVSFLLSMHAVEFALGALVFWRARGFVRMSGVLYAILVVAHLLLHHQIPGGALDRFFDLAIIGLGGVLVATALFAKRTRTVSVKA